MPVRGKQRSKANILRTVDRFIASVPWGEWRRVLVFRRVHGGRTYVRLRTWNRHRSKNVWYPTKRFFVIPVEYAEALAEAFLAGSRGTQLNPKPKWYAARERGDRRRYLRLYESGASESKLARERRRIKVRRKKAV